MLDLKMWHDKDANLFRLETISGDKVEEFALNVRDGKRFVAGVMRLHSEIVMEDKHNIDHIREMMGNEA